MQEFSIGEYVQRKFDGAVGVVKRVEPYDGDFAYYVLLTDVPGATGDGSVEDNVWAGTAQAWERLHRTHAHMESYSRDCDGDYSGGAVNRTETRVDA